MLLAIGTELAESDLWGPPLELDGALLRLDIDPAQAHGNNAADVALIGDAAAGVDALLAALGPGAPADDGATATARRADVRVRRAGASVDRTGWRR